MYFYTYVSVSIGACMYICKLQQTFGTILEHSLAVSKLDVSRTAAQLFKTQN